MKRLAFATFAGPTAWTIHNLLSTTLVPTACHAAIGALLLHGLTLLMVLLAGSGAVTALRLAPSAPGQRFVSNTSTITNCFFTLVILAQGIPNAVVSPCWS